MIRTLFTRELLGGAVTPLPWVLLGGAQIVLAWIFLQVLEEVAGLDAATRQHSLTLELTLNLFGFTAVILMFAAPLMGARMLSAELRDGRFALLASAPIGSGEIVLGKYLGLWALLSPLCLLPALNLLLLVGAAPLDAGQIAAATLGLWLVAGLFAAVAIHASTLSTQPTSATLAAFAVLLLLSVIGRAEQFVDGSLSLFGWLTWNEHLFWFLLGAVRLSDLAYFALFSAVFLALAQRRLDNRRLA
ncbi:ABC transporter permease [Marichromatium gracile]|uniref:ABC-2 type transport system permease protein n=1 Tax=Marichromatium gracile TaxID=1048 RepID=A0A4R4AKS4_MARGR|nr:MULTISPECIES: ABC transporter permease subunit [Marichromatium]MBO8085999.1 ABC transporter permease [Marichromatium sp.]MBK1707502.1 ABC transporter permease [Marichromatium gracile]MCF1182349.1 ABC transporter permease [Marichromatium gracile]RNE92021.1 ABC transporter permease [Marichromatium sp. AB31]TCW39855.1 ABC-2 type transport system permease protein [Marichromatium gracile]